MVLFDWLEAHWLMRDEWRCARVDSGELCVMIFGDLQMLVWYAGSLATQDTVSPQKGMLNWNGSNNLKAVIFITM